MKSGVGGRVGYDLANFSKGTYSLNNNLLAEAATLQIYAVGVYYVTVSGFS